MANKEAKAVYVTTFPLKAEKYQQDLINKILRMKADIKNDLNRKIKSLWEEKSPIYEAEYKAAVEAINAEWNPKISGAKSDAEREKAEKARNTAKGKAKRDTLDKCFRTKDIVVGGLVAKADRPLFTEYGFVDLINLYAKHDIGGGKTYSESGLSTNPLMICSKEIYRSWDKFLFGGGKCIHFKKYRDEKSIKYKVAGAFKVNLENFTISVPGIKNPMSFVPQRDKTGNIKEYEAEAIKGTPKQFAIKKEQIRGKDKYYVQITFEGVAPITEKREAARKNGRGVAGIDPGPRTQTIFIDYGNGWSKITDFTPSDDYYKIEKEIARLQRYIDRSQRAFNPNKYNEDGTIKRGNRDKWVRSKGVKKAYARIAELKRKYAAKLKADQQNHIAKLLSEVKTVNIESNRFSTWAERSKKDEKTKTGRCKSKKRFGKSIMSAAPGQYKSMLIRTGIAYGKEINEIPESVAATQYDHSTGKYTKHGLGEEWVECGGRMIQRDAHAAFNLAHINPETKTFDQKAMEKIFPSYVDAEKEWLKATKKSIKACRFASVGENSAEDLPF